MENWKKHLLSKIAKSGALTEAIKDKVANAPQDVHDYMFNLDGPAEFDVIQFMARALLGIAHPDSGGACDPPCGGPGNTKNGYWVCSPPCTWIPLI